MGLQSCRSCWSLELRYRVWGCNNAPSINKSKARKNSSNSKANNSLLMSLGVIFLTEVIFILCLLCQRGLKSFRDVWALFGAYGSRFEGFGVGFREFVQ